jgi:hypothetical protein
MVEMYCATAIRPSPRLHQDPVPGDIAITLSIYKPGRHGQTGPNEYCSYTFVNRFGIGREIPTADGQFPQPFFSFRLRWGVVDAITLLASNVEPQV